MSVYRVTVDGLDSHAPIFKVLVPVANPATAADLLRLGGAFLNHDKSRVIALLVLLGELEEETDRLTKLESLVQQLREDGVPVELQTYQATSVARGVLDMVRDTGVDLVVLGLRQHTRHQVILGTIAENVLAAAPCDVVVYRPATDTNIRRVVVAVGGDPQPARKAAFLARCLAEHYDVPFEAMHVQDQYLPRWEGLGRIEQALEGIANSSSIERKLVTARDAVEGIVSRLESTDVLFVGYSRRTELERRLFGDFSRRILNVAPCPVVLTTQASLDHLSWLRRMASRFSLRLTPAEQDDMLRHAYQISYSNLDYVVLILISAMLASLGLLLNSTAVIIGAMLVAPFMQPCIAYALGIASGRYRLAAHELLCPYIISFFS